MRGRFACALVVALVGATNVVALAQPGPPWAGSWKLNIAKSKYNPGPAPRSTNLRIDATADGSKTVNDTVDAQGTATHTEISAVFDGREYELKGATPPTTRAYKRAERGYEFVTRLNGKITTTTKVVASADGRTLTVTQTGADPQGRPVNNVLVYERP